jgi:hypothetical protein
MARIGLLILIAGLIGAVALGARRARRRRADATPELHRHPERLEQMLDPTDDA